MIFKMKKSIITRMDILKFGMDYYLKLCEYIIINKGISDEVYIQDITGKEIIDIKFINKDKEKVYASCILKDMYDGIEFENVTYQEIINLLNFMIKDNVSKGIIFINSCIEDKGLKFINDLNENSGRFKIDVIDGYEIIKFARRRNEKLNEVIDCA